MACRVASVRIKMRVMTSHVVIFAFALVLVGAGCATERTADPPVSREGEVRGRVIASESAEAYPQPQAGESYFGPFEFDDNASPQYPADMLTRNLPPTVVRVRLVVDEGGSVTRCQPSGADTDVPEFFAAVQATVLQWRFDPLVKMEGGPGRTTITYHGVTRHFGGKAYALPFSQDYEFTFTQRDGKGTVSASMEP